MAMVIFQAMMFKQLCECDGGCGEKGWGKVVVAGGVEASGSVVVFMENGLQSPSMVTVMMGGDVLMVAVVYNDKDEVVRIFTDMSISPSLSPRQFSDRYAFRASCNLPDKDFRYLRTVIVTIAVHRGLSRRLPCHQVTNFLDLSALSRRS
ncbi:hypothetical protein QVD17_39308 [Tagetes erecta]|uniref:Uncharacterized protein n=1 Tax=Tagetes erecta TaxID=13708 RepID=A0AAD8NH00_TARER|nr:hypothetical protein QVD17_39308 [Tagetes erecta]